MIEYILLDLDDTILDFKWAENQALTGTLTAFGIEPTEEVCSRYREINWDFWHALERKEVTREQLKVGRFRQLLSELGKEGDPAAMGEMYLQRLGHGHCFLPGALETLNVLKEKYRLFLVSNGNISVQQGRLESAGIAPYFENIFISEAVGVNKPDKAFFDHCFGAIDGFRREESIIIGDSLTSDIKGGLDAGIRTCWFNPKGKPSRPDIRPHYEIRSLKELQSIL